MASSMSRTEALQYLLDRPDIDISLDTETTGLSVFDGADVAIGVSLAFRTDEGVQSFYYALQHAVGENLTQRTHQRLGDVLEGHQGRTFLCNAQFDLTALLSVDIDILQSDWYDLPTMCQMINENLIDKSLDSLAKRYLGGRAKIAVWEWEKDFPLKIEKSTGWPNTTPRMMNDYACVDAELTLEVGEEFVTDPRWLELREDVWSWKRREILALRTMRCRGVKVNMDLVRELEAEGIAAKKRIEEELGLNPGSVNDREELFINRLKLPVLKRSVKTGRPSFDKTVMPLYDEILERRDEPAAKLVKEWRGWNTAVGLLLRKYREMTSADGRLRTEYTTHVTKTGRLSARDPNLQQISKDGGQPWNARIKACFVAEDDHVLVSFDFSQLELRIGAAYAGEVKLLEVFEEGRDIFTEMSTDLGFSRSDTKTLVYSMQYGAGTNRIKTVFNVSTARANEIRDTYYSTYKGFRQLNAVITQMAEDRMQVPIWSGRIRHLQYKSEAYKAMNSVIQGGAADIVGRVMVRIMDELDDPNCRLLLQVHDAFVFEIRKDLVDEYSEKILALMTDIDYCTQGLEDRFDVRFAVEATRWE